MSATEKSSLFWILFIGLGGFIALGLTGCGETTNKAEEYTSTKGTVTISTGAFSRMEDIEEFDYKGHTYIYSTVRDGISMTHAGHCKCNNK